MTKLMYVVLAANKTIKALMSSHEHRLEGKSEKVKNKWIFAEKFFASITCD